jgi:sugar/nucleoside kinase (ribokinase family)
MTALCPAVVVTAGKAGATLYARGEESHFAPPQVAEVDPTGAGDIFAAAFFAQLYRYGDAAAAARLATQLAAISVTRPGLDGVPTRDEAFDLLAEAV